MSGNVSLKYEAAEELSENDLDKINQMIVFTWDYHSWVPQKNVKPMAEFFLGEVIINSSRIFVVRNENEIVGVIAASMIDNIKQKANAKIRKYKALKEIILEKKEDVFEGYLDTLILNEKLLLKSGKKFVASLNLFILDEQYQGMGIGNKLYSMFTDYLTEMKVKEFFLYTDDSSNFQFYERKGLKRIGEEKYSWGGDTDNAELYYLYEGQVK
ncbi:GNAT family N-acetyltransferase [Acinetobacter gyllenbergii]|uniref:GNAT family N-acetyltransferase n=1 Tax=Acinetobacter gyllenbergii TaxID=134534 RepID=UPI0021CF8C6B|nr:GNAT family N-acetyltransferase [Acinetobacter gyllenbergii]MCU4582227.1 GNAT family N-acetyltransferase [Acinetobacter gyllenbergii]